MKKIISLFKRNYETDHKVRNEVVEGAEWVINGEGLCFEDSTTKEKDVIKAWNTRAMPMPPARTINKDLWEMLAERNFDEAEIKLILSCIETARPIRKDKI